MPLRTAVYRGFRITARKYADKLDGAGAALSHRNRWNEFGQCVTYASASRSLALLESRVHNLVGPPVDHVIAVIEVTAEPLQVQAIRAEDLPDGWRRADDVGHCQIRGRRWYQDAPQQVLLIVPSIIVPAENNFVIRGGAPQAQVVGIEEMGFDRRLWDIHRVSEPLSAILDE